MFKKITSVFLTVFAIVLLFALSSCGNKTCENCTDENKDGVCDSCGNEVSSSELDGKIFYKIKVLNAAGEPLSDMIVGIFDGEEQLAIKITNAEGMVTCSESYPLAASEKPYTVNLTDPRNTDFYYDKSLATISDGKEEITITVYETVNALQSETLYLNDGTVDFLSVPVLDDGGYSIELKEGKNYFVFVPTVRGQYRISADASGVVNMGYYGSPHFVQQNDLASTDGTGEVFSKDGELYFNIRVFNVGEDYFSSSRYVFRIDAEKAGKAIINVKCVDPNLPLSKEEIPWEEYLLSKDPAKYVPDFTVSGLSELTDFDITDANLKAVYNEEDGFYHLGTADGPVILVKLTVDSKYLASFKTIMETTQFCAYVYGDDDVLDTKINYHGMMQKYIDASDETLGVYPLTAPLKEALTVVGDAWGWYNRSSANNIFSTVTGDIVEENAYLFACCYYAG